MALLTAGVGGAFAHNALSGEEKEPETKAEAIVNVTAVSQFEGADSGWGHSTAERAITEAVHEGAATAFESIDNGELEFADGELEEIIEALPVYDEAYDVLDMAGYNEIIPDEGDKLHIDVEVTANTDKEVSYVVKHAEIQDLPNN